ncbi:molecular chaperone DnaJ [Strigomonas culicis]|uniref:Molecular chaperone DnaJ n=1 Tax=Strigomonas culicis TaxID=28005 RepID=S9UE80_9TRYP|nr:molecular chaperone DnaJ [Strigomonas culicis]|eukprot:EPY27238.1 molecular chaperone DnaJ [Strigomonas culicis]
MVPLRLCQLRRHRQGRKHVDVTAAAGGGRHALADQLDDTVRLQDGVLPCLDVHGAAVQELQGHLQTQQGLSEGDIPSHNQVIPAALEDAVRLDLDVHVEVARLRAGDGAALSPHHQRHVRRHAGRDLDGDLLRHLAVPPAGAAAALVLRLRHRAGALAARAARDGLPHHARVHAGLLHHVAAAAALRARLLRLLALGAVAVALRAHLRAVHRERLDDALVHLLQRQAHAHLLRLDRRRAAVHAAAAAHAEHVTEAAHASAAEKLREDVLRRAVPAAVAAHAAVHAGLVRRLGAVLVVHLLLLRVRQDLVRLRHLREVLLLAALIGVRLEGALAVRLLDRLEVCRAIDAQHLVVILVALRIRAQRREEGREGGRACSRGLGARDEGGLPKAGGRTRGCGESQGTVGGSGHACLCEEYVAAAKHVTREYGKVLEGDTTNEFPSNARESVRCLGGFRLYYYG